MAGITAQTRLFTGLEHFEPKIKRVTDELAATEAKGKALFAKSKELLPKDLIERQASRDNARQLAAKQYWLSKEGCFKKYILGNRLSNLKFVEVPNSQSFKADLDHGKVLVVKTFPRSPFEYHIESSDGKVLLSESDIIPIGLDSITPVSPLILKQDTRTLISRQLEKPRAVREILNAVSGLEISDLDFIEFEKRDYRTSLPNGETLDVTLKLDSDEIEFLSLPRREHQLSATDIQADSRLNDINNKLLSTLRNQNYLTSI